MRIIIFFKKCRHTTSYYKACTTYFPVPNKACTKYFPRPLRTQSLQKVRPSTTSYYEASSITKLAQITSQYHFVVLQSLHKLLPSTTSYYKASTKYFPRLFRTRRKCGPAFLRTVKQVRPFRKLAQITSVPLRRIKEFAQSTSQYYSCHATVYIVGAK